eukprot:TRINITY_DN63330_c0_g1_i1.p1 TRINITY_DN63330_c0_g1~~TRINITY_DN63330_c0_g1_i1.p1  ORF type:complete len:323 (-),score=49.67 TRINITY_DN63330_c0_g1_i1:674-1642(-)
MGAWRRLRAFCVLSVAVLCQQRLLPGELGFASCRNGSAWEPLAARRRVLLVSRTRPLQRASARRSAGQTEVWQELPPPRETGDGSGTAVSKILEAGVRLLLRSHNGVKVAVRSRWEDLLRAGSVEAVHLSGRNWRTKLDLTARSLVVAALKGARLDYGALMQGRVSLTAPAHGWAEGVFDADDFGNFLLYPQVAARLPQVAGTRLKFQSSGIVIDAPAGQVVLPAALGNTQCQVVLHVNDGVNIEAHLSLSSEEADSQLSADERHDWEAAITTFFKNVNVDLAGVDLKFAAIKLAGTEGRSEVRLRLTAVIRRIPNPLRDTI